MNTILAILLLAAPQEERKDKIEALRKENEVLRRQLEVITAQFAELEAKLAAKDAEPVPVPVPKRLEGHVTAVSIEAGLVVISLGKHDGVANGMEFTVYREKSFVARIAIDRVDRSWSAGKIALKKDDPRVGDAVSNQILVDQPMSKEGADQLREIRKELDEIRAEIRKLTDQLLPSWKAHGVVVEPLSEELKGHFGVNGVVVRRVAEGSAAAKRGLQPYDILPDLSEAELLDALQKDGTIRVIRKGREIPK